MRRMARVWALVAGLALVACGSSGGGADVGPDAQVVADTDTTELPGDTDTTELPGDADATELPGDAEVTEMPGDADVAPSIWERMCTPEEAEVEPMSWPAATKFSLAVYHFNLQYVAGGIQDFLGQPNLTDEELQDLIIEESFAPLVDFFEAHPTWGASFEMQGMMIEVLAQRYPDLLLRFGRLVRRGQVDLMSFHYSDQLYLAYPLRDQEWSWAENQRLFEGLCLPPSPAFFTQEGQYGPGMAAFIHARNGGLPVLPRNLLGFNVGPDKPRGLWFETEGVPVITTDGYTDPDTGWSLNWNFVDDAELLATGGINPYFPKLFVKSDEAMEAYRAKLQDLTDQGYLVTTIAEYRRQLEAADIPRTALIPIHDGQWQSDAGDNLFQWMGFGAGWAGDERDNGILAGNVGVSREIRAAEILLEDAAAAGEDVADLTERLFEAKRALLKAEVSDSTGWRPYIVEITYSLDHQAQARELARGVLEDVAGLLGYELPIWVSLFSGEVRTEMIMAEPPDPLDAWPVPMTVTAEGREPQITLQDSFGHHYEAWLTFPAVTPASAGSERPTPLQVEFEAPITDLAYSPALQEDRVLTTPMADYDFALETPPLKGPSHRICLGAPNGLIGLGGDRWLLKDVGMVHVAACVHAGGVSFEDQTQPNQDPVTWHFYWFEGSEADALAFARTRNVEPEVTVGGW